MEQDVAVSQASQPVTSGGTAAATATEKSPVGNRLWLYSVVVVASVRVSINVGKSA